MTSKVSFDAPKREVDREFTDVAKATATVVSERNYTHQIKSNV